MAPGAGIPRARKDAGYHPFTSPSYGIVGTDSIAYPFNEGCGTAQQYDSYVEAWIYDKARDRSASVVIHLVCSD